MTSGDLKRQLGFWDSVAINVGVIIGVGIFRTPGEVAGYLNSSPLILIAWVLGGLVTMIGVLCYAELSSCLPHTGGTYVYLREAYGRFVGFLFGWMEFSIMRAASIAAVAYILVSYLGHFIPWAGGNEKAAAMLAISFFTFLNILGIQIGTGVQNLLTFLKIASILVMTFLMFYLTKTPASAGMPLASASWGSLGPALIPILFSYGGWHQSTFMSGEFSDTKKALPLSLIMGALIVMGVYVFMNAAYLHVLTPGEMTQSKAIASDIFQRFFGAAGNAIVTTVVLISASGALNSTILTGGRIPFAVAKDYPRFKILAHIEPRFGTPMRSLMLNALWASLLVLWGNFEQLLFFFSFANWLFFGLAGISVFLLRKKTAHPENFVMFGYPFVPVLFTLSSFLICGIVVASAPRESFFGFCLLLAGGLVYLACRDRGTAR